MTSFVYRIYQLSHALGDRLSVLVEGGGNIAVAQVGLYVFRITEALSVCCERATQDLKVHRNRNARNLGNRLDSPTQPVLRAHGRTFLAGENERINRHVAILRAPHLKAG